MLKKIFVIVLSLLLLVLPLTSCGFEGSKGFTYRSNGDGTCVLTGVGTNTDSSVIIPEKSPDGDVVIAIGSGAFYKNLKIETVTIPGTVKTIESGAFALTQLLTTVIFADDGLITIGSSAFEGCFNLTDIILPETVKTVEDYAFRSCTIMKSVQVLGNGTEFGRGVFQLCGKLETVDLGGTAVVGEDAFNQCTALKSIVLPDTVTTLSLKAFSGCTALEQITLSAALTEIEQWMFEGCTALKSIELPDGVVEIGQFAFSGCSSLESVKLPSSLVLIKSYAFSQCSALHTVTIERNPALVVLGGNESLKLD